MVDDLDDAEWDRILSSHRNRMPAPPRYRAAGQVAYTARPYIPLGCDQQGRVTPTLQVREDGAPSPAECATEIGSDPTAGRGWWRPSKRAQERSHAITVAMLIVTCSLGAVMVVAAAAWVWNLVHRAAT